MSDLSLQWQHQFNRFKRQYLQLQVDPAYPERQCLKNEEFQNQLYTQIFSEDAMKYFPPQRYQLRILKELMKRIEASITDWEEESISDDLMNCFSSLLTTKMPPEAVAAQEKSYVTYTISSLSSCSSDLPGQTDLPTITILESRNLLGGTGTTGFRTWEACLQLGDFLSSPLCPPSLRISSKTVLELGSGTGYLSILCAKYLNAAHITATDGFDTVIADLGTNFFLNGLQSSPRVSTRELKWGHALLGGEDSAFLAGRTPDIVLGADVTYDAAALPALCATLRDLLELFPRVQIVIASTVRNEETYRKFLDLCAENGFAIQQLEWRPKGPEEQEGPFYKLDMPVKICRIAAPAK